MNFIVGLGIKDIYKAYILWFLKLIMKDKKLFLFWLIFPFQRLRYNKNYFVVKITKFICILFPNPFSIVPYNVESIPNVDK